MLMRCLLALAFAAPCRALTVHRAGSLARRLTVRHLSPLPNGINQYDVNAGMRANPLAAVREKALGAINLALANNVTLGEVEFPPLLGTKTEFDDVDNVQILNANSDWAMELAAPLARELGESLWLAFADRKELEVAREAWPGRAFTTATLSTIEDSAAALGAPVDRPWGSQFAEAAENLLGTKKLGAVPEMAKAPKPRLIVAVQPGDGGPIEDWLNLERCETDGALLISTNGAFDKLRGGAYPRIIFPKLADSVARFIVRFETLYYLKPISNKGRSAWLFRVYPEPWQLVQQRREDTALVATFEERPTFAEVLRLMATCPP
ncbi:hypothetical protein M885DRAFT_586875 [Pelagophyceae sp. CCMP2097]|nr:hypothetical protein M885DRAFT_586875 [Pelagophyceae sp. CCMP2097]